jgi:hypothetical protein
MLGSPNTRSFIAEPTEKIGQGNLFGLCDIHRKKVKKYILTRKQYRPSTLGIIVAIATLFAILRPIELDPPQSDRFQFLNPLA